MEEIRVEAVRSWQHTWLIYYGHGEEAGPDGHVK